MWIVALIFIGGAFVPQTDLQYASLRECRKAAQSFDVRNCNPRDVQCLRRTDEIAAALCLHGEAEFDRESRR